VEIGTNGMIYTKLAMIIINVKNAGCWLKAIPSLQVEVALVEIGTSGTNFDFLKKLVIQAGLILSAPLELFVLNVEFLS
jgi:hypothetical protein